jgi:hypothetical protein
MSDQKLLIGTFSRKSPFRLCRESRPNHSETGPQEIEDSLDFIYRYRRNLHSGTSFEFTVDTLMVMFSVLHRFTGV